MDSTRCGPSGIITTLRLIWRRLCLSCRPSNTSCRLRVTDEMIYHVAYILSSYTLYFVLGLKSRSHDRKAERSIDEENTVPNSASLPHGYWVCGNKSAAKRKHRLKLFRILNDTPEHAIDEELQVQPNYAESRVASKPPSLGHSIAETSLSQGQASDNHDSLLWDSSIPGVSSYEASTIGISTGESSSFVNNSSARSSILISSASSGLPAYNERAPSLQTRDDSSEDQELHMGVSRPELVYIPR